MLVVIKILCYVSLVFVEYCSYDVRFRLFPGLIVWVTDLSSFCRHGMMTIARVNTAYLMEVGQCLSYQAKPTWTICRDRPKPLFPVTAVTEAATETMFSVLAETETTRNYSFGHN